MKYAEKVYTGVCVYIYKEEEESHITGQLPPKNSQQRHNQVKRRSHCIVRILSIHTPLAYNW